MVVSNIVHFHPYLGKIPILTNIFQRGWNHQLVNFPLAFSGQVLFGDKDAPWDPRATMADGFSHASLAHENDLVAAVALGTCIF